MKRAATWLCWSIAAYYAVVVLVGMGLHEFCGCKHSLGIGEGDAAHCGCKHECAHEHCAHEHGSHEELDGPSSEGEDHSPGSEAENCFVCRLLSISSQPAQAVVLALTLWLAGRAPTFVQPPLAIPVLWAFAARAPPVA